MLLGLGILHSFAALRLRAVRFIVRSSRTGAVVATFVRRGARGDNALLTSASFGRARPLPPGRYMVAARANSEPVAQRSVTINVTGAPPLRTEASRRQTATPRSGVTR